MDPPGAFMFPDWLSPMFPEANNRAAAAGIDLVVPKYNPARTTTPEGAVGLGGAYMCIYPMESPGGYQLIGRTLPIWNTFGRVGPFTPAKPWLLRNFDQVRLATHAIEVPRMCRGTDIEA